MFEKFGEFDSVEELNAAAAGLLDEGDKDNIFVLAEENGIDKEDAEDYVNGDVEKFATALMAAVGKIELEAELLKINGILDDWKNELIVMCTEDEMMARAVRRKDKRIADYISKLLRYAFEHKNKVSDEIVKITKVTHNGKEEPLRGPLYLGIPNRAEVKKVIRDYYVGSEEK